MTVTTQPSKKNLASPDGSTTSARPPLVSVGVPVYNAQRYLREALDAILAQTVRDIEVIICDNASTDSTPQIMAEYAQRDPRVRCHTNERNIGAAGNFNRVIKFAQGTYFKWAAYDDLIDPTFLEKCVQALELEPSAMLVHTRSRIIDDDGRVLRIEGLPVCMDNCAPEHLIDADASSVCFMEAYDPPRPNLAAAAPAQRLREIMRSRWMFEQFGVFRLACLRALPLDDLYERLYGSEKVLMAAVAMHGPVIELDEPLFLRRYHQAQSVNLDHTQWLAYLNPDQVSTSGSRVRKPRIPGQVRCFLDFLQQVRRSKLSVRDRLACYGVIHGWCFWLVHLVWLERHKRGVLFRFNNCVRSVPARVFGRRFNKLPEHAS